MYDFVTGPLAWLSFAVFFFGILIRTIGYIRGLDWKLDRVTYSKNVSYGIRGALLSIVFWLFPFATRSYKNNATFTVAVFLFHIGLLFTPLFLKAHNIILNQRWGIGLATIPDAIADVLTIMVMVCVGFLMLRRIALPEVRIITTAYDYALLLIAVAPFITGYMASHQAVAYDFWLITHIISGEIMLIAIPFTKLSHFFFFFLSRAQLGMDFGIKRGGMKGRGVVW